MGTEAEGRANDIFMNTKKNINHPKLWGGGLLGIQVNKDKPHLDENNNNKIKNRHF
jgi:hypothetical protein